MRQGIGALVSVLILLSSPSLCLLGGATSAAATASKEPPWLPPRQWGVTFSGQVVSTFGRSLGGAVVDVGGKVTQTDEKGLFRIVLQAVGRPDPNWLDPEKSDPNQYELRRYVLNIHKEGYGLVSRVYDTSIQNGVWVLTPATVIAIDPTKDNVLTDRRPSRICTGTLSSRVDWSRYPDRRAPRRVNSQGQYVGSASPDAERAAAFAESANYCNEGISIMIPANSLVDSQGSLPLGEATVSLSTVDIYDPSSMPGDYSVDLGDRTGYMVTYGAATISASSRGRSLQLRKGAQATLIVPINPAQLEWAEKLDPNIPCLRYDESDGMWRVVGEAVLDPDQRAYVAEIDHFSALNMDLVKTDQACVRIDSSAIGEDYVLEVSLMYEGNAIVRTVSIDNTPEKIHVIYNLPSHTDINLQAFKPTDGGPIAIPITDKVTINTGAPQNPQTPNCPAYPYDACAQQVALTEASVGPAAPVLSGPATSSGTFTLSWDYDWAPLVTNIDGYELQESTTSSASGFSIIYETVGDSDHRPHVERTLTRATGDYWYRVRARDDYRYHNQGGYSPYSNIVHVAVDTQPQPAITRFVNDSSYMIVSLILDQTSQYIPTPEYSILPGGHLDIELSPVQHSFVAKNGFWETSYSRFEMYKWEGTYVQPGGATQTISLPDPTIYELLTQWGSSGLWKGTYFDSNGNLHSRHYRFSANGNWDRYVDGSYDISGTYALISRTPSTFSLTFTTGSHQATYYELWSYFIMGDGPASWPLIEYYYQGP